MKLITKLLAFILLLIWGALTMILTFSVLGIFMLYLVDYDEPWVCGGKQLLQKVLE